MKTILALVVLAACQTSFTGDAKVPNGPTGCAAVCNAWNMDLVGMIQVGEYSDGCICQVRNAPRTATLSPAVAGAAPAITGVMMQMRRAQQRAAQGR